MKRVTALLIVISLLSLVQASIVVNNYSIDKVYKQFEKIKGTIDLTVSGEDYNSVVTSNNGDEILFSDFLNANPVSYTCEPQDCSNNYETISSSQGETLVLTEDEDLGYLGFKIVGDEIEIYEINFSVISDFAQSNEIPLKIDFLEGKKKWEFSEFSEDFGEQKTGCYDSSADVSAGPLIGASSYCELIETTATSKFKLGALISGTDNKELRMNLYPGNGGLRIDSCTYNPGAGEDSCEIEGNNQVFDEGFYQVCVEAKEGSTDYKILIEEDGENCGFVKENGPGSSTMDFGIFLQSALFNDASVFDFDDLDLETLGEKADQYINSKYGGNCGTDGCILPFEISGIPQSLYINELKVDYSRAGLNYQETKVYKFSSLPPKVDFSGVLDLSKTGFEVVRKGNLSLFLNDELLLNEYLDVIAVPKVSSVVPINPPAGIPITLKAITSYGGPEALSYKWTITSNTNTSTTFTTQDNKLEYAFPEIKNYHVKVKVSASPELFSESTFEIFPTSPRDAINSTLFEKNQKLTELESIINILPQWYSGNIEQQTNVSELKGQLDALNQTFQNTIIDSDLVSLAITLFALEIPESIEIIPVTEIDLARDVSEIVPGLAARAEGIQITDEQKYKNIILNFQSSKIYPAISSEEIYLTSSDFERDKLLTAVKANVRSFDSEESFLIIQIPKNEIVFKENPDVIDLGTAIAIKLNPMEDKTINFYVAGTDDISLFVSPRLSLFPGDIDESCNFNNFCEEGENSKSCRSDCSPTTGIIIYSILGLVFILIIYTFLQMWYTKKYEAFLFEDKRQLYNLLMFITNARVRGKKNSEIEKSLKSSGWSGERIRYAIKKSAGKRAGMIEIIPITRISNYLRNRKAKKTLNKPLNNTATGFKQQQSRNINKY